MLPAPSSTGFGEGRGGFWRDDVRCRAEVEGIGGVGENGRRRAGGRVELVWVGGSERRGQPGVEDSRCVVGQGGGDDASIIALFCGTRRGRWVRDA